MTATDLATAARERRIALGISTQPELVAKGGPSLGVIRNIEQAAMPSYAATTLASLDRVLGWVSGSAAKALEAGDAPEVHEDPQADEDARAMRIGYAFIALMRELDK